MPVIKKVLIKKKSRFRVIRSGRFTKRPNARTRSSVAGGGGSLLNQRFHLDPFPQKWLRPVTYGDNYVMALPALGVASEQIIRLNSIFDPDLTGAGHQPLYRDQIQALYNAYQVRKVNVEITFTDPSQDGAFVYISSGFTSLLGQTLSRVQETPYTKTMYLNNTGTQQKVFRETIDLARAAGLTRKQYKNDIASTGALAGANPILSLFLRFGAGNTNAGAGAGTVIAALKITYFTQFYDRVIPAQS